MKQIRGAAQLGFELFQGVTNRVEQMHETIVRRPGPFDARTSGESHVEYKHNESGRHSPISKSIYQAIRTATDLMKTGAERSLSTLEFLDAHLTLGDELWIPALNGVCGDHLVHSGNPLAINMHFCFRGRTLPISSKAIERVYGSVTPHLVIMLHGLCLSDSNWYEDGVSIGSHLRQKADQTPVYLNYNSGRRISDNGKEFNRKLEELVDAWPVPVQSISLIGHSMGGLVIRSACWYGQESKSNWIRLLRKALYLGTPHHGAPTEKIGSAFNSLLKSSQYVDALAVGERRSAGIKDLKFGNLLDEDWKFQPPENQHRDNRQVVPLMSGVNHYFMAATIGVSERDVAGLVMGDLLVRLDSALGQHPDERRSLPLMDGRYRVYHDMNHFGLLHDPRAQQQIVEWMKG